MALVIVESLGQVRSLAERILDRGRTEPVVCVTTRHNEPRPLLDAEALAGALPTLPVYVLRTGELTWELNAILPERFEVFGGASRIWWPGLLPTDHPREHPLFFCWEEYEAPEAALHLLRELDNRGWPVERRALAPRAGAAVPGRVGTESGTPAAGPLDNLAVHDVVEARVLAVHRGGTDVELAPGLRCLIITKRGKPPPAVQPGWSVPVEVIAVNAAAGTVEVRWAADPPVAEPVAPARSGSPVRVPTARAGVPSPLVLARRSLDQGPESRAEAPEASDYVSDGAATAATAVAGLADDPASGAPSLAAQLAAEEIRPEIEQADADIAGLRAAAQRLTRELDAEIAAARARISEFTRSQVGSIIDGLQAELAEARVKTRELQRQLAAAEDDKRGVITELRKRTEKLTETTKELRRERDRRLHVEDQLHGRGTHADAEAQFRHEVSLACERLGAGGGGAAGPARDYVLGPDFLDSLDGLQGMDRSQVVEKIAAMLTDALPGRGHPLRTTEAGNSPARIRQGDGAKAYRWYLQHKSSAARRLHYWQLADGRIELANVAVHDDIVIR